jgi:NitT/TauT family transport system permease protein/sulfonate transport system permease protein
MIKRILHKSLVWNIVSIVCFLLIWEICSDLNFINTNFLPSPKVIGQTIYKGLQTGVIMSDSLSSLRRVILGYLLGSLLGILFGLMCSFSKRIGNIIKPIVELIRPIPPIAWIPLSILWFGYGEPSAYFLVSLGAFFPLFSNTFLGISLVNNGTVEVAKCHGASNILIFWKIILPQALPSIFTGLKTGLGVSWMIVITAELVGIQNGLGYFIQVSRAQLETEQVISGMIIIGIIGYLLNVSLSVIGKKIMPWLEREAKISYYE